MVSLPTDGVLPYARKRYDVVIGYDHLHPARAQFNAQFDPLVETTGMYLPIIMYKVADNYLSRHDRR
jgi:hypothetical protein